MLQEHTPSSGRDICDREVGEIRADGWVDVVSDFLRPEVLDKSVTIYV